MEDEVKVYKILKKIQIPIGYSTNLYKSHIMNLILNTSINKSNEIGFVVDILDINILKIECMPSWNKYNLVTYEMIVKMIIIQSNQEYSAVYLKTDAQGIYTMIRQNIEGISHIKANSIDYSDKFIVSQSTNGEYTLRYTPTKEIVAPGTPVKILIKLALIRNGYNSIAYMATILDIIKK